MRQRPLGDLVGREADVARVRELVASGARLATLLGPPGIGKTRLAKRCLEVLEEDGFADEGGAFFVDVSDVRDRAALIHALVAPFGGAEGDIASLVRRVATRGPTLVVVDDFERLVPMADVLASLAEGAPEVVVLVTSRERLGVAGEVVVELRPLDTPNAEASVDEVLATSAARLFLLRAKDAGGASDGGARDAAAVAEVVRRCEGIPLVLELAAARTRVLSVADLAARLGRGTGDRHATVEAAIDTSWQLLDAREREVLAACSVFEGGFNVEAAEHVVGDDALDVLAALRDKSLVHAPAEGRLALYTSIRAFAAARLEHSRRVRLAHASWFGARASAFAEARTLSGAPDAALRLELVRERANLLAALGFARDATEPRLFAEIALALTLLQAAPTETCLDALDAALAMPDVASHAQLAPRVLLARSGLLGNLGDADASDRDMRALLALDLDRPLRDYATMLYGVQLRARGLPEEALVVHERADASIEAHGPERLRAFHVACRARLAHDLGDLEEARSRNERARAMGAAIGDAWLEAMPLANLAQIAQEQGDFARAHALLDEALRRFEVTEEPHYVAVYSITYGDLLFEEERIAEARARYEAAARFFGRWSSHRHAVHVHAALAALEARHGAMDEAEAALERARAVTGRLRGRSPLAGVFVEIHGAHLELARGGAEALVRWRTRCRALHASDVVRRSIDARFALRILARGLSTPSTSLGRPRVELTVTADGAAFETGGRRTDLARRSSLRRILAALVAADRRPLGRDAVLEAGWPGERLLVEAANTRIRVAIATLRSLGLRDVIVTTDGGYAVGAHVDLRVVPINRP